MFNAEQCDGYQVPEKPPVTVIDRNERVESFMAASKIEVLYGGHSAFYRPSEDYIQMPDAGVCLERRKPTQICEYPQRRCLLCVR